MAIDALSEVHLTVPLAISSGGTGQASASAARTALGLQIGTDVQAQNALLQAIGSLTSAADKGIQFTGVGTVGTFDLTSAGRAIVGASNAADQRTVLGLGSIAIQSTSSVSITGGSITGITDVAIADGGTGASTASGARVNLQTPYLKARQIYTSGATWTKPSDLAYVFVQVWGGGGGSRGSSGNGGNGGTSSFGSHLQATGGGGANTFGGSGGIGSSGDVNMKGGTGGNVDGSGYGGQGGSAPLGGCGGAMLSVGTGEAGGFPGGGAGTTALTRGYGGGAGYSNKKIAAGTLGSTESVTVGAVGAAGSGTGALAGGAGLVIVEEWGY